MIEVRGEGGGKEVRLVALDQPGRPELLPPVQQVELAQPDLLEDKVLPE
jgi:hypothetical protein